jgi:hypothetical protein
VEQRRAVTTASSAARSPRRARVEATLFLIVLALQSAPLVARRYFPSEDGPPHIGTGQILARHHGALARYFEIDLLTPNTTGSVIAAALVRVSSPVTAGRLLLLLVLVSIPLAARYALTGLGTSGRLLSWLALPLSLTWFVHLGLFNFCLGTAIMLLTVGYWWRHEDDGPRATVVLGLLLLLLLLTHIVPTIVGTLLLVVRAAWSRSGSDDGRWGPLRRVAAAAAVPTALTIAYTLTGVRDVAIRQSPTSLTLNLLTLDQVFTAYDRLERIGGALVTASLAALGLLAVLRHAPRDRRDRSVALLAAAAAVFVLYVVLPDSTARDGGDLTPRLSFLLVFIVIAWLAQLELPRPALLGAAAAAVVASSVLTAVRVPRYADFEAEVAEFVSIGAHIPEGSTVVPVYLAQDTDPDADLVHSLRVRPTLQAAGWIMAERRVVDLSHYEAYFQVNPPRFRADLDPFGPIGRGGAWIGDSPPDVDLLGYEAATGGAGQIDFVIVFGRVAASRDVLADPSTAVLDAQLAEGYEVVATSSPQGLVELYRRQPS